VLFVAVGAVLAHADRRPGSLYLTPTTTPTVEFRSSYPRLEARRYQSRDRGYWVYAEADRVPADWPSVASTVGDQPVIGVWQFLPLDGSDARWQQLPVPRGEAPVQWFRRFYAQPALHHPDDPRSPIFDDADLTARGQSQLESLQE
jgi:hypothetical protein